MRPNLPAKQTLYFVTFFVKRARKAQTRYIVQPDFESLANVMELYSATKWCAQELGEVFV